MNKPSQIKTHFDTKVLVFFMIFFALSCSFLIFKIKTVRDCNVVGFKIESKSLKARGLITFTDTTKKASQWIWDFGDGSEVSYLSKSAHEYEKEGVYNVKLKVDNSCTVEQTITILPFEESQDNSLMPNFTVPSVIIQGVPVTFSDKTNGAKSWEWMFGESSGGGKFEATSANPSYTYTTLGPKKVRLAVNRNYKQIKIIEVFVKAPIEIKAPPPPMMKPPPPPGPERKGVNEEDIEGMMRGIGKGELTYRNFTRYFCKSSMPDVHLKDGAIISLKELDEDIRDKGKIKIKSLKIEKDRDGCVFRIDVNYKY